MAVIKPFKATRYNEEKYRVPLVAPPYDIISENERVAMAGQEYHMINLDKPGSASDSDRYRKSADRLRLWKERGVLIQDTQPSFYVYAQCFKHPETGDMYERTGFFCLVKLEEHYEKFIFPHERTLSAPKEDRLNLMRATGANLSPVFGLYDDTNNVVDAIFKRIKKTEAIYDGYMDADGTMHYLWRVSDEMDCAELTGILQDKNIIIADGHHRYATALNYRNEMRQNKQDDASEASYEYVLMDLINFNDQGLVILPTHRLFNVSIEKEELLKKLKNYFEVKETSPEELEKILAQKTAQERILGLYFGKQDGSYVVKLENQERIKGIVPDSPSKEWQGLEVNLLYYVVIRTILNLNDEDFQNKITYTHSFQETYEIVDKEALGCAFLLPSCTKEELEQVTLAREVMPQKSTYFFPKIFSGFVFYEH